MAQGSTRVRIGDAVVGSNAIVLTICLDIDDIDLTTAANITGTRRNIETGVTVPLTGPMTPIDETTFTWQLSIADTLEAGTYEIVFTIDIAGDFARNVSSRWVVWPANSTDLPAPDVGVTAFIRLNPDGTYSFLNAADFRTAIGVGDGDMPLIDPATANNLAIQAADGSLVDAGYAADTSPTAGSVVRRGDEGGVAAASVTNPAFLSFSAETGNAFAGFHEGNPIFDILGASGVYRFLGAGAPANRAAQRREILAADQRPAQADIAGTTHTLSLSNENQIVASQSGSATTFTISLNSVAAFAIGSIIGIEQQGAGVLSVEATAGVTLNGVDGATIALTAQWGAAALRKIDTNSWIIIGAI